MSPERDDLDREIDAVLASMAKEEPRRVNASSIRQALDASRPVRWSPWLAAAAVLAVALAIALVSRQSVEIAPVQVSRVTPTPTPARPEPSPETGVRLTAASRPGVAPRTTGHQPSAEPDLGLPPLVIASIDRPEPLLAGLIESDGIVIPSIDIAPLVVPALPTQSQPHQEKPPL